MKKKNSIITLSISLVILLTLILSISFGSYTIKLHGTINESLADTFINELKFAQLLPISKIKIDIDSPGGSIIDGLKIIDELDRCTIPVEYYISGKAYSMATIIALNAKKGSVFMSKNSFLMFHELKGGVSNSNNNKIQKDVEIEKTIEETKKNKKVINKVKIIEETKIDIPISKIQLMLYKKMDNIIKRRLGYDANTLSTKINDLYYENVYFVPTIRCLKLGLVDGIY